MREILFRGKRQNNGEWVVGCYVFQYGCHSIYLPSTDGECGFDNYGVDRATVGQYTGLKDKNGKRIFEGDILEVSWHAPRRDTVYEKYEVVYRKSGFFTKRAGKLFGQLGNYISPNVNMRCEVIGNIHDNPELLDGETQ